MRSKQGKRFTKKRTVSEFIPGKVDKNMRRPSKLQENVWFSIDEVPVAMPTDEDFSDYLWMADEMEEFDRQVEEEFWEELFLEACFEEMLAEEEAQWQYFQSSEICKSKLNPEAPEFIPRVKV